MVTFNQRLSNLIKTKNSNLCVGLDMDIKAFNRDQVSLSDLEKHSRKVIEATGDLAVAYKPNLAFFERWGSAGIKWLENTMELFPRDAIVIGDAKRGDIGNTALHYAHALFKHYGFDAVTINPYMGNDSIHPFIQDPEKGVFILCRTSNPSASDLQDLKIGNIPLFIKTAEMGLKLNKKNNVGLVVGATAPQEISKVRAAAPLLPFLIPGIGAQGGNLRQSLEAGNVNGTVLINISRGISFAGDMSFSRIRSAAKKFLEQMRFINNG
ncbi:MAG: orotidine-5'-phosphate decarboxylase [Candidatus Neomarinimicrobiota bacterium]